MGNEQGSSGVRCAGVFSDELGLLTEPYREFVIKSFAAMCPEYFWHVPAALGGNNHPRGCRALGGLVKHTKYVCWWADRIIRFRDNLVDEQKHEIFAACLLHDIVKYELPFGVDRLGLADGHYCACHGHWAASLLWQVWDVTPDYEGLRIVKAQVGPIATESFGRIVHAVAWHMWRWGAGGLPNRENWSSEGRVVFETVALADYLAASQSDDALKAMAAIGDSAAPAPWDTLYWTVAAKRQADQG